MKRYDIEAHTTAFPMNGEMNECKDGDYVLYKDAAAEISRLQAKVAAMEKVVSAAIKLNDADDKYIAENYDPQNWDDCWRELKDALREYQKVRE